MSDSAPAAPQPAPAPPAKKGLPRWASIVVGVVALGVGGLKLLGNFTLPTCDSSRSLDTIKSIFKDKNLPEPTLTGAKTVADQSQEKTCQAAYEIPNEKGTLDYRVYWEGWTVKVMITKVSS